MQRYSVTKTISFEALERFRGNLLSLVLTDMYEQLERNGGPSDSVDTIVRPWPIQVGESSLNGYDKLVPRIGINVICTQRFISRQ